MKKLAKSFVVVMALTLLALAVAACSGKSEPAEPNEPAPSGQEASTNGTEAVSDTYEENGLPKNENVILKVGFFEAGNGRAWFDYAVESFMEKFPNVKVDITASPKIDTLIQTKVAANNDEDMFDLFSAYWLPLAEKGKLEPLDDLWDRELYDTPGKKARDLIAEGLYTNRSRHTDGKGYEFPQSTYVGGLFYDKTLFAEKGWNEDPKTWEEFLQLCEAIKNDGITPIVFSGLYNYWDYTVGDVKLFEVAEKNGRLDEFTTTFRQSEAPYYTSPEMLEIYEKMVDMGKQGYFGTGLAALNHTQSQMLVLQHKAALVSSGDWIANEMKDSTPDGFEWGYMSLPLISDPSQSLYVQSGAGMNMLVWADKPELNKKWSKELLLWLLNMDNQKALNTWGGALSIRTDFADDPERVKGLNSAHISILDYFKTHTVKLEKGYKEKQAPNVPAVVQARKLWTDNIPLVLEGKKEPKPILEQAEKLFEAGLKEGDQP